MGIRERHEREREAVRRRILDAARELFVHEGYSNVSIRKIAERVEYSPASIYSYFPSKDDIFLALAEEGFQLVFDPDAPPLPPDPLEALRAIFWRCYEFSKRHPAYFWLMFVEASVPRIGREYERFGFVRDMRALIASSIERCIEMGVFPRGLQADAAFRILIMAIHGIATFRLSNRLSPDEDADAIAADMLDVAIAGLRAGAGTRCHTPHGRERAAVSIPKKRTREEPLA